MTTQQSSEITPEQQQRRCDSVKNALASSRLSGGKPSAEAIRNLDAYAQGQVTIDALVEAVVKRHQRP